MNDDYPHKWTCCALAITMVSFFGWMSINAWIDYQKSKEVTRIEYIYVPVGTTTTSPDTVFIGSPEYYKRINKRTK